MPFPVHFLYITTEGGNQFVANCFAIPREGEWITPENGTMVIVDHVMHLTRRLNDGSLIMVPHVILRNPTDDDNATQQWAIEGFTPKTPSDE